MTGQLSLIFKVLVLSVVGSAVIKYGIRYGFGKTAIAPSHVGALIAILLPSIVLGLLLWWRSPNPTDSPTTPPQ